MKGLKELYIENFRGIKNLKFEDFKDINILIGENNTGKTSILESIRSFKYFGSIEGLFVLALQRERGRKLSTGIGKLKPYDAFINLFNVKEEQKRLSLKVKHDEDDLKIKVTGGNLKVLKFDDNNKEDTWGIDNTEELDTFDGEYISSINNQEKITNIRIEEDINRIKIPESDYSNIKDIEYISPVEYYLDQLSLKGLGKAIKSGLKDDVIKMLKIFDKDIIGYELISEDRGAIPYLEHKRLGFMPLSNYGDGVKKALTIAGTIVSMKGGILLIDEVETAIHIDALKNFIKWIMKICQDNEIQVFLTTHSMEAIDIILESTQKDFDKVACYRLEKDEEEISVTRFSGEKLYNIRNTMGVDIR